ncbi:MAG: carbohydrate kinase family protein [Eubacteriales bacterium]|nr:carbohydrate kinase family protein [Eubacteriales bacterium]
MEQKSAIVIGGMNMDIIGKPKNALLLRESNIGSITLRPGGVGRNIAHGLAALGVPVELITPLGRDAFAPALIADCAKGGVGLSYAVQMDAPSGAYLCLHDEAGDMLSAVNEMAAMEQFLPNCLPQFAEALQDAPMIVLDANVPEEMLLSIAQCTAAPLVLDPVSAVKAPRALPILRRLLAIKPNHYEAEALTGIPCEDMDGVTRAANWLLDAGVERVFLSLSGDGVYYADAFDHHGVVPAYHVPHDGMDCTGAGDAMTAALVYGLQNGASTEDCAKLGCAAAALQTAQGFMEKQRVLEISEQENG